MNFQWILLAFFLAAIINEIAKALTQPMHRNILNFISIPVAFIIAFIMQALGLFQMGADYLVNLIGIDLGTASGFASATLSTLLSPVLFVLVYNVLLFVLRLVYVNLISKFIESKQVREEKRLLKEAIREEKRLVKGAVYETEKKAVSILQAIGDSGMEFDVTDYEHLDEDEIEDMVERRVRKEKRARRKRGFFRESRERKSVSIITAAVSGFLAFAIGMMPMFHIMSVLGDITGAIDKNNPDENQNAIYLSIDLLDEHIVKPYEKSFIYQVYKSMALVDLMNGTVRLGGKMDVDGTEYYADDVIRGVLSNSIKVATQIMSTRPSAKVLSEGLDGIIKQPFILALLTDLVMDYLEGVEITEPAEGDVMGGILNTIILHYKEGGEEVIAQDMSAISHTIAVLVEKLPLSDIMSGKADFEAILGDQDTLKSLLMAMSGLTPYNTVIGGTFELGIGMIGPMLGAPQDNAVAFDSFISKITTAAGGVASSENAANDYANLQKFFKGAAEYVKNADQLKFIDKRIADVKGEITALETELAALSAIPAEDLTEAQALEIKFLGESIQLRKDLLNGVKSAEGVVEKIGLLEKRENIYNETVNPDLAVSIWDYITEPIMVIDLIQNMGKDFEAEGNLLKTQGEEIAAEADKLVEVYDRKLQELTEDFNNNNITLEQLQEQTDALQAELDAKKNEFTALGDKLLAKGEALANMVEPITNQITELSEEITARTSGFLPLINHFMNWMNVQKPFMIAGEDTSLAPMSITVPTVDENGETTYKTYTCNTDIFDLETLIKFITGGFDVEGEGGEGSEGTEGGAGSEGGEEPTPIADEGSEGSGSGESGSDATMEYVDINEILNQIPFQDLIKQLVITSDEEELKDISPMTDLINHLILSASTRTAETTVDNEWVKTQLTALVAADGVSDGSKAMANKIIGFMGATEEERNNIDYKGVTVEKMLAALKFDETWTEELKQKDSEHLIDIVFTIIDILGGMGGEGSPIEAPVNTADESTDGGEQPGDGNETQPPVDNGGEGETGEGNELDAMLNLVGVLGITFDKMAQTYCLGDLPELLFKALLTHEALSIAMMPAMYHDYVVAMEQPDFSYEKCIGDLLNTIKGLLEQLNGNGGEV